MSHSLPVRAMLTGSVALLAAAIATVSVASSDAAFTSTTSTAPSTVTAAVDWTPPALAVAAPSSTETGAVTIQAMAADAEGSALRTSVAVSPAGTGQWTEICAADSGAVDCAWDTTGVTAGTYDVRTVAVDAYGNTATEVLTVDVSEPVVSEPVASEPVAVSTPPGPTEPGTDGL